MHGLGAVRVRHSGEQRREIGPALYSGLAHQNHEYLAEVPSEAQLVGRPAAATAISAVQPSRFPQIPITELGQMSLSGSAAPTGDSAFLTVGTTVYGTQNIQGDLMDLSQNWTGAEFNIVGDCCGSRADFNAGSTITVGLEADDGSTAAPSCLTNKGTTGESNSLSFIAAPSNPPQQQYPSILFTEASTPGSAAPSCDTRRGSLVRYITNLIDRRINRRNRLAPLQRRFRSRLIPYALPGAEVEYSVAD